MASHACFNVWANEKINLLIFLHLVVTFCYLKKIAEPFFAKSCYTVIILIDLGVHAELGIQAKSQFGLYFNLIFPKIFIVLFESL